jgi:exonuclease III
LNSPQAELPNGAIVTWVQEITGSESVRTFNSWRDKNGFVDTGTRWDAAERSVVEGLARFDLSDVFRKLNSYEIEEYSWYWKGKSTPIGRRFDHVFASEGLCGVGCRYLHEFRKAGLSDHSAIEVDFELPRHRSNTT